MFVKLYIKLDKLGKIADSGRYLSEDEISWIEDNGRVTKTEVLKDAKGDPLPPTMLYSIKFRDKSRKEKCYIDQKDFNRLTGR